MQLNLIFTSGDIAQDNPDKAVRHQLSKLPGDVTEFCGDEAQIVKLFDERCHPAYVGTQEFQYHPSLESTNQHC